MECMCCKKEFIPHDYQQKTCSRECRDHTRYIRRKQAGKTYQGIKGYTYTCKQCGKVYHPKSTERDKFCSRECAYIWLADDKAKRKAIREEQKKLDRAKNQEILKALREQAQEQKREEKIERLENHICEHCGNKFTANKIGEKHCTPECKKKATSKAKNRYNEIRKRDFRKNGKVDNDITLEKLIKKHKGKCKICGRKVDIRDCRRDANDTFIVGKYYPTIDHILPRVRGGTHTWENVQLAHLVCNSIKHSSISYGSSGQLALSL